MTKKSVGSTGEDIACGYLAHKKYKILDRNYRTTFGEIDIVAKAPDKTLVFVEVKTMKYNAAYHKNYSGNYPQESGNSVDKLGKVWQVQKSNTRRQTLDKSDNLLIPEDQMTYGKRKRFQKIAGWYANNHPRLVKKNGYRLDCVTVSLYDDIALVSHYQNIVGV